MSSVYDNVSYFGKESGIVSDTKGYNCCGRTLPGFQYLCAKHLIRQYWLSGASIFKLRFISAGGSIAPRVFAAQEQRATINFLALGYYSCPNPCRPSLMPKTPKRRTYKHKQGRKYKYSFLFDQNLDTYI